ncbi:hypothetical protein Tco_1160019 [Tanacetum coccineum]
MNRVNTFFYYRTELVEESSKKAKAKIAHESSLKRAVEELEQESSKKKKLEEDKESEELKKCLEIVPDYGDDVTIDATPLSIKSPSIGRIVGIKRLLDDLEVTAAQVCVIVAKLKSLCEDIDSESTHMVAASKVPMLKPENGNTALKTIVVEGVEKVIPPTTAKEKA